MKRQNPGSVELRNTHKVDVAALYKCYQANRHRQSFADEIRLNSRLAVVANIALSNEAIQLFDPTRATQPPASELVASQLGANIENDLGVDRLYRLYQADRSSPRSDLLFKAIASTKTNTNTWQHIAARWIRCVGALLDNLTGYASRQLTSFVSPVLVHCAGVAALVLTLVSMMYSDPQNDATMAQQTARQFTQALMFPDTARVLEYPEKQLANVFESAPHRAVSGAAFSNGMDETRRAFQTGQAAFRLVAAVHARNLRHAIAAVKHIKVLHHTPRDSEIFNASNLLAAHLDTDTIAAGLRHESMDDALIHLSMAIAKYYRHSSQAETDRLALQLGTWSAASSIVVHAHPYPTISTPLATTFMSFDIHGTYRVLRQQLLRSDDLDQDIRRGLTRLSLTAVNREFSLKDLEQFNGQLQILDTIFAL